MHKTRDKFQLDTVGSLKTPIHSTQMYKMKRNAHHYNSSTTYKAIET